jgi:hypothetical protein
MSRATRRISTSMSNTPPSSQPCHHLISTAPHRLDVAAQHAPVQRRIHRAADGIVRFAVLDQHAMPQQNA